MLEMDFTYNAYKSLIERLVNRGFNMVSYEDWYNYDMPLILRHDIDFSIEKALKIAAFENSGGGVRSTYFVLVSSNFYNVLSKCNADN